MLRDLNEAQLALAGYMSDLSEEAYFAGWMAGFEFACWSGLQGHLKDYGRLTFNENIIENLKKLSVEANGWIYFDDKEGEKYVSFGEWNQIFINNCKLYP